MGKCNWKMYLENGGGECRGIMFNREMQWEDVIGG